MRIGQTSVRRTHVKGRIGQLLNADNRLHHSETIEFGADRAAQVAELVVDTATNGATYSFNVGDEVVPYKADGATSKIEIADGLAAAFAANAVASAFYSAESDGVDTVTITARWQGSNGPELSSEDALMTLTVTTAANDGADLPFGRVVLRNSDGRAVLPLAANLVAAESTITLTYENTVPVFYSVSVGGQTYTGSITMATSLASSTTALAAAINAIPGVSAANVGDVCVIEEDVAGSGLSVSAYVGPTATTGDAVAAESVEGTSFDEDIFGISMDTYDEMAKVVGDSSTHGYRIGTSAECLLTGDIWMENGNAASHKSAVYLGTSSTEAGKCFDAAGSGRILLPKTAGLSWAGPNLIRIKRGF